MQTCSSSWKVRNVLFLKKIHTCPHGRCFSLNSILASYFPLTNCVFETPSPLEIPLTFLGMGMNIFRNCAIYLCVSKMLFISMGFINFFSWWATIFHSRQAFLTELLYKKNFPLDHKTSWAKSSWHGSICLMHSP